MLVWVAAAALINDDGSLLVQKRAADRKMAGLWEFPGGKLEPGETPEAALVRELHEELAINVAASDLQPLSFASEPLAADHLILMLFICRTWHGEPRAIDAEAIAWVRPEALSGLAMPPADKPLVQSLQRYLSSWRPAGQEK